MKLSPVLAALFVVLALHAVSGDSMSDVASAQSNDVDSDSSSDHTTVEHAMPLHDGHKGDDEHAGRQKGKHKGKHAHMDERKGDDEHAGKQKGKHKGKHDHMDGHKRGHHDKHHHIRAFVLTSMMSAILGGAVVGLGMWLYRRRSTPEVEFNKLDDLEISAPPTVAESVGAATATPSDPVPLLGGAVKA